MSFDSKRRVGVCKALQVLAGHCPAPLSLHVLLQGVCTNACLVTSSPCVLRSLPHGPVVHKRGSCSKGGVCVTCRRLSCACALRWTRWAAPSTAARWQSTPPLPRPGCRAP